MHRPPRSISAFFLTTALLLIGVFLPGCTYGLLYTDIKEPLVINMHDTPAGGRKATLGMERVSEPFFGITVEVNSIAIGQAAKQAGINKIYYADLHTKSILLGIWQKQTVLVTGE